MNQTGTLTPPYFRDFSCLARHLDRLGQFRMRPGLERITAVLSRLGLLRPACTVVQVVGTNGKGSTACMLATLACAHGLRTGLYTSPHFVSVRERVRINGSLLSETDWTGHANTVMAAGGAALTYFELLTALALVAFKAEGARLIVLEAGLGGTWDATTAVQADLTLFTPVDLDHQAVLGADLATIARDKAGALRTKSMAVSAPQRPEAARELEARAAREKAALIWAGPENSALPAAYLAADKALDGPHQLINARLALCAWQVLEQHALAPLSERSGHACGAPGRGQTDRVSDALARAWLPGRLQRIAPMPSQGTHAPAAQPLDRETDKGARSVSFPEQGPGPAASPPGSPGWPAMLVDGAHNSHGLAALGLALARQGVAPGAVVFSCLADKDVARMIPQLRALATGPIFVPPVAHNPRAMPPGELAALIGLNALPAASLADALRMACSAMAERIPEAFSDASTKNPLLLCGSLYLLGEFYAMRPECLDPPRPLCP